MTSFDDAAVRSRDLTGSDARRRGVLVARRTPASRFAEDTGYVFRIASLIKRLLDALAAKPGPLSSEQLASVINARRFLDRANRGRDILERREGHFVSDINAVDAYSSARRVLDTLGRNGTSAKYLQVTRDVLHELERGRRYADINEDARQAAHEFFTSLAEVFGRQVAAEASGFRPTEPLHEA